MKQAGFRREEVGWQEVSLYKSKYQLGCVCALRNYFFLERDKFFFFIYILAKQQATKGMLLVKMSVTQLIKILRIFCCYFIIPLTFNMWYNVFNKYSSLCI